MAAVDIHAVALLNICDYSTRINAAGVNQYVGAFFGTVTARRVVIEHAYELRFDLSEKTLDETYFSERATLLATIYPQQQIVGWFAAGFAQLEPWMHELHAKIAARGAPGAVAGLFTLPFPADLARLPLRTFVSSEGPDAGLTEVPVAMVAEPAEQIALNDIFAPHAGRTGSAGAQLAKQTKALLRYHKQLTALQEWADAGGTGPAAAPLAVAARVSTLLRLLESRSRASQAAVGGEGALVANYDSECDELGPVEADVNDKLQHLGYDDSYDDESAGNFEDDYAVPDTAEEDALTTALSAVVFRARVAAGRPAPQVHSYRDIDYYD